MVYYTKATDKIIEADKIKEHNTITNYTRALIQGVPEKIAQSKVYVP